MGEGSQYISLIVDATDDEDAAVLYVCVCSDGGEMEGGEKLIGPLSFVDK